MPFCHQSIRSFRKTAGWTQVLLAEKLGVPQSSIARWESGRITPNAEHIGLLCDFGRVEGLEPSFFFPPFSPIGSAQ